MLVTKTFYSKQDPGELVWVAASKPACQRESGKVQHIENDQHSVAETSLNENEVSHSQRKQAGRSRAKSVDSYAHAEWILGHE